MSGEAVRLDVTGDRLVFRPGHGSETIDMVTNSNSGPGSESDSDTSRPQAPVDPNAARAAVAGLSRSFAAGDYPQAEGHARLLLGLVPADPNLRRILAAAELAQGRIPAALTNLRRALVVGPDYMEARYNLANTMAEIQETEQAISQYRRGLKLAPDHLESLINLGGLLSVGENPEQAWACFRHAAILDPTSDLAAGNLGVLALGEGAPERAVRYFAWAQRAAPMAVESNLHLANALRDAGRVAASIPYYCQALALLPEAAVVLAGAAEALSRIEWDTIGDEIGTARELLIACLRSAGVESNTLNRTSEPLIKADMMGCFGKASQHAKTDDPPDIPDGVVDLIAAHLMDSLVSDPDLEASLVSLRRRLLVALARGRSFSTGYVTLARALGRQGVLNEFLWPVDAEEERLLDALLADMVKRIDTGGDPEPVALTLLAAYRALTPIEPLRRWAMARRGHVDAELAEDLDFLILDRVHEEAIAASIPDLTPIDDAISALVKAQYEDNPYPRWNSLAGHEPIDPVAQVLAEIAPNTPPLAPLPERPRVLIAGCGAGRQAAQAAMTYRGASILAMDLSRPSLAHAKRKSEALGLGSIRFARADILALPTISERFDIIECTGVLHHMADPEAGLQALLAVLAPGGVMKIALYSAAARANVTRLREWIAERGYPATLDGIRRFRAELPASNHPDAEATRRSIDYNATSAIRDLLFHAQEHQFTVPELECLMVDNALEFLGFLFLDPAVKTDYRERFPADPSCTNLSNWAAFETDNPLTFVSMYQFWCRRRG